MNISMPGNANETAYIALTMIDELAELLVERKLITREDFNLVLERGAMRLSQGNSFDTQRAAKFIADWVKSNP